MSPIRNIFPQHPQARRNVFQGTLELLLEQIQPNSDVDPRKRPVLGYIHFGANTAELSSKQRTFLSHQHIVRPFDACRIAKRHKAFSDGDGSAKREPGCLLGQNVGSHESRHPKTFAGSRRPNAIIPSPSSSLTIGQHHRQRRRSSFGKTTRLGHGGAHFVKPVNFP